MIKTFTLIITYCDKRIGFEEQGTNVIHYSRQKLNQSRLGGRQKGCNRRLMKNLYHLNKEQMLRASA